MNDNFSAYHLLELSMEVGAHHVLSHGYCILRQLIDERPYVVRLNGRC